jgi:hypothetical protein
MHRPAKILSFLSLGALLHACATPAPEMFGAARHEVSLGGIDFVVFHKGERAEVVRLGYLTRAQRAPVPGLMVEAAEQATGCRVKEGSVVTGMPGDTGEARMTLAC